MKKFKSIGRKLIKNRKGQGMTEYILLLVVVVGIVMMFQGQIKGAIKGKISALQGNIESITPDSN